MTAPAAAVKNIKNAADNSFCGREVRTREVRSEELDLMEGCAPSQPGFKDSAPEARHINSIKYNKPIKLQRSDILIAGARIKPET